jgi:hypothetical protein
VLSRKWGFGLVVSGKKGGQWWTHNTKHLMWEPVLVSNIANITGAPRSNPSHDRRSTGDSERAREQGIGATSNTSERTRYDENTKNHTHDWCLYNDQGMERYDAEREGKPARNEQRRSTLLPQKHTAIEISTSQGKWRTTMTPTTIDERQGSPPYRPFPTGPPPRRG